MPTSTYAYGCLFAPALPPLTSPRAFLSSLMAVAIVLSSLSICAAIAALPVFWSNCSSAGRHDSTTDDVMEECSQAFWSPATQEHEEVTLVLQTSRNLGSMLVSSTSSW